MLVCPPNEEAKAGGAADPDPPKLKLGLGGVAEAAVDPPPPPKAKGEAVLLEVGAGAAAVLPPNENGEAAAVGLLALLSCFPKANIPPLLALVEETDPNVLEEVEAAGAPVDPPPNENTPDAADCPNPEDAVVVAVAGAPKGLAVAPPPPNRLEAGASVLLPEKLNDALDGSVLPNKD